ncbi:glycoside hydrolase family 19 protein [Spirosoma validum]|uniref:Glycoside hydrolase family 19 catalytic domain-containing protein n=1 Tax=Spirosoma validum TaxID=2771355 RepID=A0A927B1G1_9BACT|nr:glycoside hydrolase family 19 protein [Spirosoma validum]MBD2753799.1 hypothetical protein [Spirosoma validum]
MKPLTASILIRCGANPEYVDRYVTLFNELLPLYGINTWLRLSHFLAQLLHESGGFRYTQEIASGKAYEGRKDLGNTQPGDGVKFKGRGLIQLTGRDNYTAFGRKFKIDCVNHPELIEEPKWALASALDYWNTRKLNAIADQDDVNAVTRKVNGGTNGLLHRRELLVKCKTALTSLFD